MIKILDEGSKWEIDKKKNLQSAKSITKMVPSIFEEEQLDELIKATKNIKYKQVNIKIIQVFYIIN